MLVIIAAATALLAQATPASAPAAASPPAAVNDLSGVTVTGKKQKGAEDPKEVVCHSEAPIGSRFPVKVCARREEINERRFVDQMEVRKMTALRPGSGN